MPTDIQSLSQTLQLRLWSLFKVPMLSRVRPRVEELNDERVVISVPLLKRNRNHLDSMYFGVLACGADLAGGMLAMRRIWTSGKPISLIFKNFNAQFLKRPEAKTLFICEDGELIDELVKRTVKSGEREEAVVRVKALCPDTFGEDPVAAFELTLSLKLQKAQKRAGLSGALSRFLPDREWLAAKTPFNLF